MQDAFAKGEVFLGNGEQGYNVIKGLPHAMQGRFTWKHGIIIVTPDRKYIFTCETEKEQEEWKAVFSYVMEQPMTPQEYASKFQQDIFILFSHERLKTGVFNPKVVAAFCCFFSWRSSPPDLVN